MPKGGNGASVPSYKSEEIHGPGGKKGGITSIDWQMWGKVEVGFVGSVADLPPRNYLQKEMGKNCEKRNKQS